MHTKHIETLQTTLKHWSKEFQHSKTLPIKPDEYEYFKSVLEEIRVTLPCSRILWSLPRIFEMISLYFVFQEVKNLEIVDASASPDTKAAFELLQYGAVRIEEEQKKFEWFAELVGGFSVQLTQDFLDVVDLMPEYFNDRPIASIGIH